MKSFTVCKITEFKALIDHLVEQIDQDRNIVLLEGDLGSGKTALTKAFVAAELGAEADSPTFSIVNEYRSDFKTLYHFDLYRLKDIDEIEDIGIWDYLDSGNPCFIEWPHKMAELLPKERCIHIRISVNSNQCREYSVS